MGRIGKGFFTTKTRRHKEFLDADFAENLADKRGKILATEKTKGHRGSSAVQRIKFFDLLKTFLTLPIAGHILFLQNINRDFGFYAQTM
jgi:hypothetical protein